MSDDNQSGPEIVTPKGKAFEIPKELAEEAAAEIAKALPALRELSEKLADMIERRGTIDTVAALFAATALALHAAGNEDPEQRLLVAIKAKAAALCVRAGMLNPFPEVEELARELLESLDEARPIPTGEA